MSEEIKEDDAALNNPAEDSAENTDSAGQEEKQVTSGKKSGKKKWIFFVILAVILVILGLATFYMPDRFPFLSKMKYTDQEIEIDEDNLREEILSPFFIPPGPAKDTIRIDLSVVWDGLASVRFKKKELSLRNMMYQKFYTIAEQNPDLNQKISYMENEVSSMLRGALGVQNLVVKIKEIRYF